MADRHPNKEIHAAVLYVVSKGWTLAKANARSHAWGRLFCPSGRREGCIVSVYSTPRVPENEAEKIRKAVDRCDHRPRKSSPRGGGRE
jgi:hypothetical protein